MKTLLRKNELNQKNKVFDNKQIWELLSQCEDNINSLLKETKLLLDNGFYARSFLLSFSALEEMGKRLMICDYITGIVSHKEFVDVFKEHTLKIAYLFNQANLTKNEKGTYDAEIVYDKNKYKHWILERHKSLYIDYKDGVIINPLVEITDDYAVKIYEFLMEQIKDTNFYEEFNGRIGSKAFYK